MQVQADGTGGTKNYDNNGSLIQAPKINIRPSWYPKNKVINGVLSDAEWTMAELYDWLIADNYYNLKMRSRSDIMEIPEDTLVRIRENAGAKAIYDQLRADPKVTSNYKGMLPGYYPVNPHMEGDWQAKRSSNMRKNAVYDVAANAYPSFRRSESQKRDNTLWSSFDSLYTVDVDRENPSNRHYIFITRPDLNIYNDNSASQIPDDPELSIMNDEQLKGTGYDAQQKYSRTLGTAHNAYFRYLQSFHPEILANLTGYFSGFKNTNVKADSSFEGKQVSGVGYGAQTDGTKAILNLAANSGGIKQSQLVTLPMHSFISYLTPRIESLQLPDFQIKSDSIVQPYTHYAQPYTRSATENMTGGTFSIEFREDRWLSISKLFYAWVYYENAVMRGYLFPKNKYIRYNSIDYACSIYDFLVDETGENVIYWAKYTGCVPTNVPLSNLSFSRGGESEKRVSIDFSYFFVEHMDPQILVDFNFNSLSAYIMNEYLRPSGNYDKIGMPGYQNYKDTRLLPMNYENTVGPGKFPTTASVGYSLFGESVSRPVVLLTSRIPYPNNPTKVADDHGADPQIKLRWIPYTPKTITRQLGNTALNQTNAQKIIKGTENNPYPSQPEKETINTTDVANYMGQAAHDVVGNIKTTVENAKGVLTSSQLNVNRR